VLGLVVVLGVVSLVSTLLQMIVPLAVLGIGGFAFYKIVLEGRDEPAVIDDELAEAGQVVQGVAVNMDTAGDDAADIPELTQQDAEARLSAVEQAQQDYVDTSTPAEEILKQIQARKDRLQGDDTV
jgi:hypothetical protein